MPDNDAYHVQEAIRALKNGQIEALDTILAAYQGRVMRLAYYFVKDEDEACDLVQDIFLRMCDNIHKYDESRSFKTWLMTVAARYCISHLRARQRRRRLLSLLVRFEPNTNHSQASRDPEDVYTERVRHHRLLAALDQVSPRARAVFIMREIQDMPTAEIATILGISPVTVRRLSQMARRKLAAILTPDN